MAGVIEQIVRLKDEASKTLADVAGKADTAGKELDQLGTEAKDAGNDLGTMESKAQAAGDANVKLATGTLAASLALAGLIQNLSDSTNELTNWSTRTGVAADTLGGLRLAAQGAGLDFQSMAEPLLALSRNTAQAAQGNADLAGKFDALGIATKDADGSLRLTEDVLRDLMTRLSDIKDPAERAAAATALLGEQGTRFLQALGNPAALDHFVNQAREFGVNTGPQAAASAALWERNLATLRTVVQGTGQDLLNAFGAGAAGGVVQDFTLGVVYMGTVAETVITEIVGSFRRMFEGISKLASGDFRGAFGDITDSAVLNVLGAMPEALDKARSRMDALRASMQGVADATGTGTGGGAGGGFTGAMNAATAAVEKQEDALKRLQAVHMSVMAAISGGQALPSAAGFTLDGSTMSPFERALQASFQARSAAGGPSGVPGFGAVLGAGNAALGAVLDPLSALSGMGPQGAALAQTLTLLEAVGREGNDKIVRRLEDLSSNVVQGVAQMPELFLMLIDRLPEAIGRSVAQAIAGLFDKDPGEILKLGLNAQLNILTGGLWGVGKGIAREAGADLPAWMESGGGSNARTASAMLRRPAMGFQGGGHTTIVNGFVSPHVLNDVAAQAEIDYSPWGVGRGRRSTFGGG